MANSAPRVLLQGVGVGIYEWLSCYRKRLEPDEARGDLGDDGGSWSSHTHPDTLGDEDSEGACFSTRGHYRSLFSSLVGNGEASSPKSRGAPGCIEAGERSLAL